MSIAPLRESRAPAVQAESGARSSSKPDSSSKEPRDRPDSEPAQRDPATDPTSPFARLLVSLGREASRGEAQMKSAMSATQRGGDLGPSQLLALQAGVYRYSETVDLASKLVDRATSGVKTVIQGQ